MGASARCAEGVRLDSSVPRHEEQVTLNHPGSRFESSAAHQKSKPAYFLLAGISVYFLFIKASLLELCQVCLLVLIGSELVQIE
jgi:hypothetical protein